MTQEDKELLLQDLCARLPYGIKVLYNGINCVIENIGRDGSVSLISDDSTHKKAIYLISIEYIKPYLRPMSSVTEEEEKELIDHFCNHRYVQYFDVCNKYHIDYRFLIEKGLAIEAPEGMYK